MEFRSTIFVAENLHRTGFGAAHDALLLGLEIVVVGEVEPAMYDVECELRGKIVTVFFRVGRRGVGGDADLAGNASCGAALERDHVGRRRIRQEVGVQLRERGVSEKDDGEFAGRAAAAKIHCVLIEDRDRASDRAAIEAQARVLVRDGDGAGGHGQVELVVVLAIVLVLFLSEENEYEKENENDSGLPVRDHRRGCAHRQRFGGRRIRHASVQHVQQSKLKAVLDPREFEKGERRFVELAVVDSIADEAID